VDDGKSTLIEGCCTIPNSVRNQLAPSETASNRSTGPVIFLAYPMIAAEREQGITMT